MRMALDGKKVIELSDELAGVYCSMQLGDAGAEVIKVEPLDGAPCRHISPFIKGESALFIALNRNKKSICVDTGKEEGREIVRRLASNADVFIYSGKVEGVQYETLSQINPRLIYCEITPFEGEEKHLPASELEVQAASGFLQSIGEPGGEPVRIGADVATMSAAFAAGTAILAALFHRHRYNQGQKVEISLLRALIGLSATWLTAMSNPDQWRGIYVEPPTMHKETGYKTKDVPLAWGLWNLDPERAKAAIAAICREVGLERLIDDPWFAEQGPQTIGLGRDAQESKPLWESAFESKSATELAELINQVGGLAAPFQDYDAVFHHPQVTTLEILSETIHPSIGKVKMIRPPWNFSEMEPVTHCHPPLCGEHTTEILAAAGYAPEEISHLEEKGIIRIGGQKHVDSTQMEVESN